VGQASGTYVQERLEMRTVFWRVNLHRKWEMGENSIEMVLREVSL